MKIHNFLKAELEPARIHDGEGLCMHATIFPGNEIDAPVQFINYTVIPPQGSIGLHKHGSNNEFYVILEGEGVYEQDGEKAQVESGDIIMNAPAAVHALYNTGSEDMRVLVFEVLIDFE